MAVNLKHDSSGVIKECPEGFSWTTFFFPYFVPLFRGMWGTFVITLLSLGLAGFYYMFKINKIYAISLLEGGYKPASELDLDKLKRMGIEISSSASTIATQQTPKEIEGHNLAS